MKFEITSHWKKELKEEMTKDYFQALSSFLETEYKSNTIFPPKSKIFNAFNRCKLSDIKVVILGQDPYHGAGQANGLCFSVNDDVKFPPSLRNIFKEINETMNLPIPESGNLERWADQGVFLLNATLTVRESEAGSHQKKGWEIFTDAVIEMISQKCENIVFILWGAYAQKKGAVIDESKHLVLKSVHPSPLSARRGFFGNEHFNKANVYLEKEGKEKIIW